MKRMSVLSGVSAILAVTVVGSAARATAPALSPGTGSIQCTTSAGYITGASRCDGGTDSGSVSYAPYAGLQGQALGQGLVEEAGVFGVLNYSLEVTGGNVGDTVLLDVATGLSAVPNNGGYTFAETLVSADSSAGVTICSALCGAGDGMTGFNGTLQVDALSGSVYANAVHLEIEVIGALGDTVNGGTASADPYIYVDPSVTNASDYSVLLSPNIGNGIPGATVPEPAAWTFMLIGAGGVGLMARRRRRVTARPA